MNVAAELLADEAEELIERNLRTSARRMVRLLLWISVVPLVAAVMGLAYSGRGGAFSPVLIDAAKTWSVIGLTFLAGIRFGIVLNAAQWSTAPRQFWLAGIPPVLGWATLFMPEPASFALLAVAFSAMGAWDAFTGHNGQVISWYADIRIPGTIVTVFALIAALFLTA